jgi:hypothetical protein
VLPFPWIRSGNSGITKTYQYITNEGSVTGGTSWGVGLGLGVGQSLADACNIKQVFPMPGKASLPSTILSPVLSVRTKFYKPTGWTVSEANCYIQVSLVHVYTNATLTNFSIHGSDYSWDNQWHWSTIDVGAYINAEPGDYYMLINLGVNATNNSNADGNDKITMQVTGIELVM